MERTVLHIDMNAFFASVEQQCNPKLWGKPIGIIGSAERTVVTTASYEARKFGVRTGMNKYEARQLCPQIILVIGDNRKYIDTSIRVLDILKDFSPLVEPFSIDEAFLDITNVPARSPKQIATVMKGRIKKELGLGTSVGIGPNKLVAKLASGMEKPDGLVVITQKQVSSVLKDLPVQEICGIGPGLTRRLGDMDVFTCGELANTPVSVLRRSFGITGERLSFMARGLDSSPVLSIGTQQQAKSIGHSFTLPRDVTDKTELKKYLLRLSEMVGARARKHTLMGTKLCLTVRYRNFHTFTRTTPLPQATNDTRTIYWYAKKALASFQLMNAVRLLGVSLGGLASHGGQQLSLFNTDTGRTDVLRAMDEVNERFGGFTLTWGTLLENEREKGVISPSWRPTGVQKIDVM